MKFITNSLKVVSVLFLFLIVASCDPSNDVLEFNNTRTSQDVQDDFAKIDFVAGINDLTIEGNFSGINWNFRVIIPESASELNKLPLVVCLHGGTTRIDPDLHKHTSCLEEPGFADFDVILLCPNSDGFIWYDGPQQEKVMTLTELAKNNLPVDTNKIAIMGYSDGANGAWFYAQHYPTIFSAAIPISSLYNPIRPGLSTAKIDIPLYVIHGEEDQLFLLSIAQRYIDETVAAGTDLEFIIAPELEHYNACAYVPYLKDAANWLENTVWN
ncbi:MAG: dienelactone hydrolase family protein [Flavobacteriaceae bacterium]